MSSKAEDHSNIHELNLVSRGSSSITPEEIPEILKKFLGDISKRSVYQQIGFGAVSGLVAGTLFSKVGKMAALMVGGSILILQVGIHQGIIMVDWRKLDSAKQTVQKEANKKFPRIMEKMRSTVLENRTFMVSFAGGFLAGFSYL